MADQKIITKTDEAVGAKAADGADRTLIVTISTNTPGRGKDVVPDGMEAGNDLRNPVVAAWHDRRRTGSPRRSDSSAIS